MRNVSSWRALLATLGLGALVNLILVGAPWRPMRLGRDLATDGLPLVLEHALGIFGMCLFGTAALLVVLFMSSWVRREL